MTNLLWTQRINRPCKARDQRGETLVEFALALTLFLTVIFGTLQYGVAVWQYNMLSNLAQEGARWASVHGKQTTTPADRAAVEAYVQGRGLGMTGITVDTYSADVVTLACTGTATNPSALTAGDGLCVKVQKPVMRFTTLLPFTGMPLSSQAQMIMAR